MPTKKVYTFLFLIVAAIITFNYSWLKQNQQPVGSDMALHARYANEMFRSLYVIKNPIKFVEKMIYYGPSSYYPPFYYDISALYQLIFGINIVSIAMTSSFFVVVFGISIFFIGRKIFEDDYLSLFAVCLTFCFPLFNDSTREIMLDFPLTAMAACSFVLLLYNDEFQSTRLAAFFGIVFGLGILTKLVLPTYLFLPAIFVLVRGFKKNILKTILNLSISTAIILCISLPWLNSSGLLNANTLNSSNVKNGLPFINIAVIKSNLSISVLFKYLSGLYNFSSIMWLLFIIAFVFSFHRKILKKYVMVYLLYLSSIIFWYLLINTKEPRYNLAHLIAVSLIFMSPLLVWEKKLPKYIYGWFLSIFSLILYSMLTFGFPVIDSPILNKVMGYSQPMMLKWASRKGPPERRYWPTDDIFKTIIADWEPNKVLLGRKPALIYTNSDVTGLDQFTYQFYADCQYKIALHENPSGADYFLHYGLNETFFVDSLKVKKKQGYNFPVVVREFKGPVLEPPYDKIRLVLYKRKTLLTK